MKRRLFAACIGALVVPARAPLAQMPSGQAAWALSADGRWRARGEGGQLVIDDTRDGARARALPARGLDGRGRGGVAEIHALAARRSFVVVFESLDEMWEVSTDPQAEPIYDGLVHDFRMGEGIARPGFLNPRRTRLDAPLRGLHFDRSGGFVIGRTNDTVDGRARLQVWQLDIRRRIGERLVAGDPDLASAHTTEADGREILVIPDRAGGPPVTIAWRGP
jgi:hypothetical protein